MFREPTDRTSPAGRSRYFSGISFTVGPHVDEDQVHVGKPRLGQGPPPSGFARIGLPTSLNVVREVGCDVGMWSKERQPCRRSDRPSFAMRWLVGADPWNSKRCPGNRIAGTPGLTATFGGSFQFDRREAVAAAGSVPRAATSPPSAGIRLRSKGSGGVAAPCAVLGRHRAKSTVSDHICPLQTTNSSATSGAYGARDPMSERQSLISESVGIPCG